MLDPQVNGVVTTLTSLVANLSQDHEVKIIEPSQFKSFPIPVYPEIRASFDVFNAKSILKSLNLMQFIYPQKDLSVFI